MERVLITGGAGFIGTRIARLLMDRGVSTRILDNLSPQIHGDVPAGLDWLAGPGVEFRRDSILNEKALRAALEGVDTVIHLAAETGTGQSMYEVARYNSVNTYGTALLLDILANDPARTVKRVLLASSRSIYGEGAYVCEACSPTVRRYPEARQAGPMDAGHWEHACPDCGGTLTPVPTLETDPPRPASIYAATKFAQEDLVRIGCASLGIGYAILRLQNVYGEGQSLNNPYTGILSIFSTRIRRNLVLPIFEDGAETRDFVHVDDVAAAFVAAAAAPEAVNDVVNVGAGVPTPVREMAEKLNAAFEGRSEIKVTGQYRLGDIRHNCADISRLRDLLGLAPRIDLDEGLARFARWVLSQPLPEDRLDAANAEMRARKLMG